MKIAVIGAGAIGSLVAAYLAKGGQDVLLIAHDQNQVDTINDQGLTVLGVGGGEKISLRAALKLDRDNDLVIFATKTQDLERAYQHNNDFLERGFVLTTQNGVQADNILSCHYEKEEQLSSIVMFGATYSKKGEVTYNFPGDWIIGKPFTPIDAKFHTIKDALETSGLNMVMSDEIVGMKWLKLFVNFNNCLPAIIGKSMQETFADLDLCRLSIRLLKEGWEIVHQVNIHPVSLPQFPVDRIQGLIQMPEEQAAGIVQQTLTSLSKEPLYGSILQSIMRGRPSEIDFINGEVVVLAKQMQARAPLNERIVDMVHEVEQTGKYFSVEDLKKLLELNAGTADQSTLQG